MIISPIDSIAQECTQIIYRDRDCIVAHVILPLSADNLRQPDISGCERVERNQPARTTIHPQFHGHILMPSPLCHKNAAIKGDRVTAFTQVNPTILAVVRMQDVDGFLS